MNTLQRPTSITVMGILNLVFGGMSLIFLFCAGSLAIITIWAISIAPPPAAGAPAQDDPREMFRSMDAAAPSLKYYALAISAATFIESLALLGSGWGLLKMRRWGRSLALFYAVFCILGSVTGLIYSFAVLNPAMRQWAEEGGDDAAMFGSHPALDAASTIVFTLFFMALAVANLIVMMMPSVKQAFANARADEVSG